MINTVSKHEKDDHPSPCPPLGEQTVKGQWSKDEVSLNTMQFPIRPRG